MMYRFMILFLATTLLCAEANSQATTTHHFTQASLFHADSLAKEISTLSSDDFQGRKPFTVGEKRTINYLRSRFRSLGLAPGNGKSYFQEVPMVDIATVAAPALQVHSAKEDFSLKGLEDYVIWTDRADKPLITLNNDELVFAGYGVVAPEYNWNDYAGLNVTGKIVLVLVNDPGFGVDSTLFKGDTMTYYGRWTYKFEEAARQGAKGCLIIHSLKAASYPFAVLQNGWNNSKLTLDTRGKKQNQCDVIGWVTEASANKLLAAAGMDSSLLLKANQRGFTPVPLHLQLSTTMKVKATYNKSHNVSATIPGSKYPNEYILYTAHWDHLGIGKPDANGDSIYNGALDNASGTAGLLELARAFKALRPRPQRTLVFLALTAEEQGLWGSAYYAQNPVFPLAKTVADINMDGLNYMGKTCDVTIVGAGQSDLEDWLQAAAKKQGRYLGSYGVNPAAGHYYRSDHFNFAKVGVPAIYVGAGIDVAGKGKAYGQKIKDDYGRLHYHRPSDEYNPATMNLEGAEEDLRLLFELGKKLAFSRHWPQWKAGSEFKAVRALTKAQRN